MATYDGSIKIDSKIDSTGAVKGATAINAALELVKGNAAAAGAALAAAFAPAIIVTLIITTIAKLGELGKKALEISSDLNEVQNVVDVTFGSMADSVNNFADSALESFGLSELSAKQYASTLGAMFKSMGFATSQAAEMSEKMTALAGDMASFYNLDTNMAFEKIRSGISGETEPLKQLGINLSVANLQAYAMSQGISTAYNSMTEMQKAVLRYNYILSVTSDAQGDFARTSNSWANQTKLLSEQWKELLGLIGPFIQNVLLPLLQGINIILSRIIATLKALGLGNANVSDSAETAAASETSLADGITDAGNAAKRALAPFDELNKLQNSTSDNNGAGFDMPDLGSLNDTLNNIGTSDNGDKKKFSIIVTPDWQGWEPPPIASPLAVEVVPDTSAFPETAQEWQPVLGPLPAPELVPVLPDLSLFPETVADWLSILTPLPDPVYEPNWGFSESLIPETELARNQLNDMWEGIKARAEQSVPAIVERIGYLGKSVAQTVAGILSSSETLKTTSTADLYSWALGSVAAAAYFKSGISQSVYDGLSNALENISGFCESAYSNIYSFATSGAEAFVAWGNSVISLVSQTATAMRDSFTSGLSSMWESFSSWAKGVGTDISGFFSENKDRIATTAVLSITIGSLAAALVLSGGTLAAPLAAAAAVAVPALATGAVIPPNNPYLAVVGDQRNGTNIEAPLDTLVNAFKVAAAEMNSGNSDTVVNNVLKLDGRTIYSNQQRISRLNGESLVKGVT